MTWFKVDDGLHKHRKRIRVGVSLDGFAAMGLWAVAGSWCSDELTDGWIPDDVLDYLAPHVGQDLAKRLEAAGLWHRVTRYDEEGWQFHDWDDHEPSREKVLAERQANADRQQRWRDRRNKLRNGGETGTSEGASQSQSQASYAVRNAVTSASVTGAPTRPDPTNKEQVLAEPISSTLFLVDSLEDAPPPEPPAEPPKRKRKSASKDGTRIPDDFAVTVEMVAWAKRECPDVDGRYETAQFVDFWRSKAGPDARKIDWKLTWQMWLRRVQSRIIENRASGKRSSFTTPASNAPHAIPLAEQCPQHRGQRAGKCSYCRAHEIGQPNQVA